MGAALDACPDAEPDMRKGGRSSPDGADHPSRRMRRSRSSRRSRAHFDDVCFCASAFVLHFLPMASSLSPAAETTWRWPCQSLWNCSASVPPQLLLIVETAPLTASTMPSSSPL